MAREAEQVFSGRAIGGQQGQVGFNGTDEAHSRGGILGEIRRGATCSVDALDAEVLRSVFDHWRGLEGADVENRHGEGGSRDCEHDACGQLSNACTIRS